MNVDVAFPRVALPSVTSTPTVPFSWEWPSVLNVGFLLLLIAVSSTDGAAAASDRLDPRLTAFLAEKRVQMEALAQKAKRPVPKLVQDFFAAAARADFHTATNAANRALRFAETEEAQTDLQTLGDLLPLRQPLMESLGVWELYDEMNPKFLNFLGQELMKSIPAGSIYFGGSDEGRFLPTLFSKSQVEGRPFFTLTQNQLADGTYLSYLQEIYGAKIRIANSNDSQRAFQEYLSDAQRRLEHDKKFPDEPRQIKPDEQVRIVDDRVQVSGVTAVMAINALLAKVIFDRNPGYEFYVEESHPIDWMYPYLSPHEFIFKLHRQALREIPSEAVRADHQFWTRQTDSLVGPWLRTNTPLRDVIDFADRVHVRKDLKSFKGDREFLKDTESRKAFARMRAASAGLYAWRADHAKDEKDRQRMSEEADYAFRQGCAIDPASPDAVPRYVTRLAEKGNSADALRMLKIAAQLAPEEKKLKTLLDDLADRPTKQ